MFNYLHRFSVGLHFLEMVDQSSHWQQNSCVYFCWYFVWPICFDPSNKEKAILILFLAQKNWVWWIQASILTGALSSRHISNDEEGGSQSPSHSKRCYRSRVGLCGWLAVTEGEPVGVPSGLLEISLQEKLKKRFGEKRKAVISYAGRMTMGWGVQLDEKQVKVTIGSFQHSSTLESMQMHYFQNLKWFFKDLDASFAFRNFCEVPPTPAKCVFNSLLVLLHLNNTNILDLH